MASPPFNINQALPGDTDIVSQHPTNARTFRDVVESWLLIQGNVNGRLDKAYFDFQSSPTLVANVTSVWADTLGYLKMAKGGGAHEDVGVPVGTILDFAGSSAPNGYLLCFGQNVSRTTYARLFSIIGTQFGVGDGSTTFGIPDLRGRTVFGLDNMGGSAIGRLTNTFTNGITGTTLGGVGGHEAHVLTQAQLAAHKHHLGINSDTGTVHSHPVVSNSTDAANAPHDHTLTVFVVLNASLGTGGGQTVPTINSQLNTSNLTTASSNANHAHNLNFTTGIENSHTHVVSGDTDDMTGGGAGHNNLPPGMVLNKIIKH